MAKFRLEIGLDDNTLKEDDGEVSGLAVAIQLRWVAQEVQEGIRPGLKGVVMDNKGNEVGGWRITRDRNRP